MRKIIRLAQIVILVGIGFSANAQCTPNTNEAVDITNLSSLQLCEGVYYDQVISLSMPTTSPAPGLNGSLDSITINSISTLSTYGLSYECHNSNCNFIGGDYGCLRITGTPTSDVVAETASINTNVSVNLGLGSLSIPQSFDLGYSIEDEVICNPSVGLNTKSENWLNVYPSPLSGNVLNFSIELNNASIYDLIGNEIIADINGASVDVSSLNSGIYVLKTSSDIIKFIVE